MQIKERPEDFIVEEIIKLDCSGGDYIYVKLTKTDKNTVDVIEEISKKLRIPFSKIGFAGNKDKIAITIQYISIPNIKEEKIQNLKLTDVVLEIVGRGNKPIYLGMLEGNKFKIKFETKHKIDFIENYFGPQRFSKNNHIIGKLIIQNRLEEACELIKEKKINSFLKIHKNNFVSALLQIRKKRLLLYIHAYQSYLWNKVVEEYLGCKFVDKRIENVEIPMISFDIEFKDPKIKESYLRLLKEEGFNLKDFIIRSIPEITPTCSFRDLIVDVKEFQIDGEYVSFFLPKGAYATVVLEKLETFKNSP